MSRECFSLSYPCLHKISLSSSERLSGKQNKTKWVTAFYPLHAFTFSCQADLWAQGPRAGGGECGLWWQSQGQSTFSAGAIYFQASVRSLPRDENRSVNRLLPHPFGGPFGINIKAFCIFIIPPSALSKAIWWTHKSSIVSTWTLKRHQQVQTQVENSLK